MVLHQILTIKTSAIASAYKAVVRSNFFLSVSARYALSAPSISKISMSP